MSFQGSDTDLEKGVYCWPTPQVYHHARTSGCSYVLNQRVGVATLPKSGRSYLDCTVFWQHQLLKISSCGKPVASSHYPSTYLHVVH